MPADPAPISLSRTAMRRLAMPLSRQTRTMSTERTSTTIENHANARSEKSWMPKNVGLDMRVDPGLGSPVQTVLCTSGSVTQRCREHRGLHEARRIRGC